MTRQKSLTSRPNYDFLSSSVIFHTDDRRALGLDNQDK